MKYSIGKKAAVIKRMMPPECASPAQLSKKFGISEATLFNWRKAARVQGVLVPDPKQNPEQWSSANKFAVVLETARMNEAELSAYGREKGLYVEQIKAWRQACENANADTEQKAQEQVKLSQADRKRIKQLERELARKEKALAEAVALMVLRKKLEAFYSSEPEDE